MNPIKKLIHEHGVHASSRKCGCCEKATLYAITYEPNTKNEHTLYVCSNCDVAGQ